MKLKEIIWFTGIWLYPILEIPLQGISYTVQEVFNFNIPNTVLLLLPIPAIIRHTIINIRRKKRGHSDFGFKDAIGATITDEEHSKAKHEATYPPIPQNLSFDTPSGLVLGKHKSKYIGIPLQKDGVNIFTIGVPGSGKSVLIQNVLRANILSNSPINWALIDIKGEHYQRLLGSAQYKADPSNSIHVIAPSNRNSFGWDVFYSVRGKVTDTEILKCVTDIAEALVCKSNEPYFEANGKKIMSGLLFFYIKEGVDFIPAIQNILRTSFSDLLNEVVEISESKGYNIVLDKLKGFVDKGDNESIQDVEATMKTYLDVFSFPDIVYCLQFNSNKTSPAVLSGGKNLDLAIEESMLEVYQPIFRLITIQILKYCENTFKESDERKTLIILDEAARCGKISGIENALATLRSRHVSTWQLFQDISQFKDIYGNTRSDTLLNLCEIKLFLSGSGDKATYDYVSAMAGEYEVENLSYSKGALNSTKDTKYSRGKRPIVNSKDLMQLRSKSEMIAFVYGKYYRFEKLMYFNDPILNNVALEAKGGSNEL